MRNFRINMNLDQYEALTDLICFAYDNGYYHNKYNTTHNVLTIWQTQLLEQKEYDV